MGIGTRILSTQQGIGGLVGEPLPRAQDASWEARFWVSLVTLPTPAQATCFLPIPCPFSPFSPQHEHGAGLWPLRAPLLGSPSPCMEDRSFLITKVCPFFWTL